MNKDTVSAVAPIVLPVMIGLVAIVVIYHLFGAITKGVKDASDNLGFTDNDQTKGVEKTVVSGVQTNPKLALSYPINVYSDVAEKLYKAMKGVGTDTGQVVAAMNFPKNQNDWNQLIKSFGIRDGEDLLTWIRGEYAQSVNYAQKYGTAALTFGLVPLSHFSSLNDLNAILRGKKITQYLL